MILQQVGQGNCKELPPLPCPSAWLQYWPTCLLINIFPSLPSFDFSVLVQHIPFLDHPSIVSSQLQLLSIPLCQSVHSPKCPKCACFGLGSHQAKIKVLFCAKMSCTLLLFNSQKLTYFLFIWLLK